MRLDVSLVRRGLAETRERAQELIRRGAVLRNGTVCNKNSAPVEEDDLLQVTEDLRYVGRGGHKLEKALQSFSIDLSGKTVLDVGASTGGFTDCALQRGAVEVFAVDVGHGQLAPSLCEDPRVHNLEGIHVKDLSAYYNGVPDFICVDVSFLSLEKVLPHLVAYSAENTDLVTLVKPQFEIRHQKSVLRDPKLHRQVLRSVADCAHNLGYGLLGADFSPMKGTEGNIEYLFHLRLHAEDAPVDFASVVQQAHKVL